MTPPCEYYPRAHVPPRHMFTKLNGRQHVIELSETGFIRIGHAFHFAGVVISDCLFNPHLCYLMKVVSGVLMAANSPRKYSSGDMLLVTAHHELTPILGQTCVNFIGMYEPVIGQAIEDEQSAPYHKMLMPFQKADYERSLFTDPVLYPDI